ncbi:hypothetical protein GW765_02130 [Candidatus Parcubacteria bacterium]|uniref:Uncharacterized protein n=1 Tax=Candidatus Uhrbacteria bacterium CG_4_9_14_3_um_filter_41_35 TaxID=1975034 RepID=A0A2M7XED4_9BACT|nr:hypothetical protein [Candidatus Parcubacteria bacterium]PIQ67520.1 MAG: hypothetical protein COV92_02565 [Candidatus Uhrbacteria bacterium CG11_big_fil_rev_8_21_14_0_20_41_9]PIZ53458.1 MAG: hypothetical protein COY25_03500 [Candidatus Uhrbacteria bacterium CG_4_10_14_0_2_um_filter_41_7]PJA46240.1 MAG: hypothetical protein CO173_03230 [Candidatus Uhrbacteria bacterium CG_4_9_14_3_um_filter_41_35]
MPETNKHNESESHHKSIFELLVVTIILMIVIFGIFAYVTFFSNTTQQSQDQTNSLPQITSEQQAILDSKQVECPTIEEPVIKNQTMDLASISGPSFDYLNNWHIATRENLIDGQISRTTFISSKPLFFCAACEGQPANIQIHSELLSSLQPASISIEDYIKSIHTNEFITKINDFTYRVTGNTYSDNTGQDDFEKTYYITDDRLFSLTRRDIANTPEENSGYELIKSTIHFGETK